MNVFSSFLLGLVQGVAEFLPISSSGHLAIAQNLLHIDAEVPEFFDVLLHLGTLGAVFVVSPDLIRPLAVGEDTQMGLGSHGVSVVMQG